MPHEESYLFINFIDPIIIFRNFPKEYLGKFHQKIWKLNFSNFLKVNLKTDFFTKLHVILALVKNLKIPHPVRMKLGQNNSYMNR